LWVVCTLPVTPVPAQGGLDAQVRELDAIRVTALLNQAFEVHSARLPLRAPIIWSIVATCEQPPGDASC